MKKLNGTYGRIKVLIYYNKAIYLVNGNEDKDYIKCENFEEARALCMYWFGYDFTETAEFRLSTI